MDELTIDAVQKAENTSEDSQLIANVVSVVNDDLVNKVVEEVSKTSINEKQSLSAKVMKSIVETDPNKIENLSNENKEVLITKTVEAAKNQAEGNFDENIDLSNTLAEIITNSDAETAAKVLDTLDKTTNENNSKLSLNVVSNLSKQDNYEEKIEIRSVSSTDFEQNFNKVISKAIENVSSENDLDSVTDIVENSKGTIADKIIDSANESQENKKKITEVIINVVEKNPEKAVEIIEKNKNTKVVAETVKTKIENEEAVTTKDFEEVFDTNVSPN